MPWDSFVRPGRSHVRRYRASNDDTVAVPNSKLNDSSSDCQMPGLCPPSAVATEEQSNDLLPEKIRQCAKQLRELGFCSETNGDMQRLMVYAQAADGDLVNAIDMIDEEQKAYRQRRSRS